MLHGYRLFSEEIFNEYAAQTMFFQRQAFLTEKKPESARFCLAFFDFQKKPKVLKKSQNFKSWLQTNQIGNPASAYRAKTYERILRHEAFCRDCCTAV